MLHFHGRKKSLVFSHYQFLNNKETEKIPWIIFLVLDPWIQLNNWFLKRCVKLQLHHSQQRVFKRLLSMKSLVTKVCIYFFQPQLTLFKNEESNRPMQQKKQKIILILAWYLLAFAVVTWSCDVINNIEQLDIGHCWQLSFKMKMSLSWVYSSPYIETFGDFSNS